MIAGQQGNMTGIAALAAAAAATSKIASPATSTATVASTMAMTSGGQTIKVVQAGGNIMSTGKQTFSAGELASETISCPSHFNRHSTNFFLKFVLFL
mgnify:CR=1 FL=1